MTTLTILAALAFLPSERLSLLAPEPDSMLGIVVVLLAILAALPPKTAKAANVAKGFVHSNLAPASAWDPVVWLMLMLHEYGPVSDEAIYRATKSAGISQHDVNMAAIRIGIVETWDLRGRFTRPQWSLPRLSDYRAPFKRKRHPDLRVQSEPWTRTQAPPGRAA